MYDYSDRGISEKYYSLEFSSLTIVVNSEHFITSKHERNSMKKTENVIDSWKQVEQNVMVCNWCIEANGPKELYIYSFVILNSGF